MNQWDSAHARARGHINIDKTPDITGFLLACSLIVFCCLAALWVGL